MLSSAVLLILSFPNFNQPWCAWVALVPWLVSVRSLRPRQAFWWSYLAGLVFFLVSIWWLIHVTLLGWLVLCAYLALYFGLFGWVAHTMLDARRKTQDARLGSWVLCPASFVAIPCAWVSLEFLRSHLLSGFGWNLLGYSQTPWLALIQMADVTGVWGVSWLIVLVNVALADALRLGCEAGEADPEGRMRSAPRRVLPSTGRTGRMSALLMASVAVTLTLAYGLWRMPQVSGSPRVRVAVVQGNIPQEQKWDEAFRDAILERYEGLTHAAAAQAPQLIIWPEASVPGILGEPAPPSAPEHRAGDEAVTTRIRRLAQSVSLPLLVGAPMAVPANGVWRLTNSAALLGRDGAVMARYDKLHLVPFGEFVPFESLVPSLRDVLPPIGDFVPGHEYTVFETRDQRLETGGKAFPRVSGLRSQVSGLGSAFSVLVCFEDVFPELARRFVQRGAQWLVTITNDAWFGHTAAPYQHAQASTFRAVELRVPMVRAANTGWSGCIDSRGRWLASVKDPHGEELFVEGIATCEVTVAQESRTLYRQWGDWFAWVCLLGCLGWAGFAIIKR